MKISLRASCKNLKRKIKESASLLFFIFYVIIKRKRGFCCETVVDIIKIFKVVNIYCGSRDSFFFPLACGLEGLFEKKLRIAVWVHSLLTLPGCSLCAAAPVACFRTICVSEADRVLLSGRYGGVSGGF